VDDLKKLLENAGVISEEEFRDNSPEEDVLNGLSRFYQFEISDEGIDVFTEEDEPEDETTTRWVRIARFPNFDDMLHEFGKM